MTNFVLDFEDGGLRTWNRYWLTTLIRTAAYSTARRQAALNCVDVPYTNYTEGAGPPKWFLCKIGANYLIVLQGLNTDTAPIKQWYNQVVDGGSVTSTFAGRVAAHWLTMATALATAIEAALGTLPTYARICITGHDSGAAVGQVLALLLNQHYVASKNVAQFIGFGTPKVGDERYAANFSGLTCYRDENPNDPVVDIPADGNVLSALITAAGNLAFPTSYARAGVGQRWQNGVGPNQSVGIVSLASTDADTRSLARVLHNTGSVRSHLLYYYALGYYNDTLSYFPSQRLPIGLVRGYDLAALDALNALLSVDDGLVGVATWPVDPGVAP